MIKKGILLAGGYGTRMSPLTKAVNKQLLPIYDKPLIFYPLSILMLAGIKDILIIVNQGQIEQFKKIIPANKNLGIKIHYAQQKYPKGLPEAFTIGKKFVGKDDFGNKYYQTKKGKRFVIYNGEVDASKIPNEWYSWMHFTKNKIENIHDLKKFDWQKPHQSNMTGSNQAYSPKDNTNALKKKYKSWKN